MQSENQVSLLPIPASRWENYQIAKRNFRDRPAPEVFFERECNCVNNEPDAQGNDLAHTLQCGDKHRGSYVRSNESGLRQIRELTDHSDSRGGATHPADFRIRRLTPLECERLMGLPDDWLKYGIDEKGQFEVSDSQKYKLAGNGVVVNVVEEIIKNLIC